MAHTGQRPITWLLTEVMVDARWNLVHATHTTPTEPAGVRRVGAAIVIYPATEANLGDGEFDLPGFAAVGGRWSLGADSHVPRNWSEELRLLEYSQRLTQRKRNVGAQMLSQESTAAALFDCALKDGLEASGQALVGIVVRQRADFVTIDTQASALVGVPPANVLDAYVFSSPAAQISQVFVAGNAAGADLASASAFAKVMEALW